MENSLYLAQLLGMYFILVGLLMMFRQKFFIHAVRDFIDSRVLRFLVPIFELLAGIALVLAHNVWTWGFEGVVTVIGWVLIVEALFYLALPEKKVVKWLTAWNKSSVYLWGGALSILIGLLLAVKGFEINVTLLF